MLHRYRRKNPHKKSEKRNSKHPKTSEMQSQPVQYISECFVKPQYISEESKQPYYLMPGELNMLSWHHIQKGLIFAKPHDDSREDFMENFLDRLKSSFSLALAHFYPLAGRLVTKRGENASSSLIFVDCNNSPGAKLIHAKVNMEVSEIISSKYVPLIVRSFFDHKISSCYAGHTKPLVSIQVTEMTDGVIIGCSMNHAIADGSSYWHFWNILSEIFQGHGKEQILHSPVPERCIRRHGPVVDFPVTFQNDFVEIVSVPEGLLERKFHFSAESIAKLKAKANLECNTNVISSFQSLNAHLWRSITRARCLPNDQIVTCSLASNNRPRMEPPLSPDCFGCLSGAVVARATVGELLKESHGWSAWKLHQAVINYTDTSVQQCVDEWFRSPSHVQLSELFAPASMNVGSSPRFDMYGNEFGLGKALATVDGTALKFDGNIQAFPGRDGGQSMIMGVCLEASSMKALESDEEFMAFVS